MSLLDNGCTNSQLVLQVILNTTRIEQETYERYVEASRGIGDVFELRNFLRECREYSRLHSNSQRFEDNCTMFLKIMRTAGDILYSGRNCGSRADRKWIEEVQPKGWIVDTDAMEFESIEL